MLDAPHERVPGMKIDVTICPDHQQRRPPDAPRHALEQLRRRFVGPVQVFQHDQHRLNCCCASEEVAHALKHVVACLVGGQRQRWRQVRIGDTHFGNEARDLGAGVAHRRPENVPCRDGQSVLDGLDEGDVGQRPLHVVTLPPDDEHAGCLRLGRDLVYQPRFSKTRFASDKHHASATRHGAARGLAQQRPFLRSSDIRRAASIRRSPGGDGFAGNSLGFRAPAHLPQAPPLRETLQLDALMIFERDILGGTENGFQGIRHQDLLSVGLCHDAGSGVDAGPEKVVSGTDCFAGVQPDADFYRVGRMSAVVVVERALDADSALDGLTRRLECHHEAVAGRLDLLTGVFPDLPPHDLVMLIHDPMSSRLTLVVAKASRADDVGEQHGHGRRLGHGACLPRAFSRTTIALVAPLSGRTIAGS